MYTQASCAAELGRSPLSPQRPLLPSLPLPASPACSQPLLPLVPRPCSPVQGSSQTMRCGSGSGGPRFVMLVGLGKAEKAKVVAGG